MRRIRGCHARSSLRASRPFRDVARSNIAPHVSSSLLARTRASLRSEEPPPPRVEVMELRPPAWDPPPPLALWIEGHHRRPGNRRHRMSRSGSHSHRSHWPGSAAARAIGQPPSLMNRDGLFCRRPDVVRLDQITLSGPGFL
jgi:hypothetical protein